MSRLTARKVAATIVQLLLNVVKLSLGVGEARKMTVTIVQLLLDIVKLLLRVADDDVAF